MRRAWVSLAAAAFLCGCGGQEGSWQPVSGIARGGGLQLTLVGASIDARQAPWRQPPPGTHCIVYKFSARSVDGVRHELRPDDFRAGHGTPLDAVGRCFSPQLEPTWVEFLPRTLWVTVVSREDAPPTLMWRPHDPG
jgi:hypothetical protein